MYQSNQYRSSNGSDYYHHGESSRSYRQSDPNSIEGVSKPSRTSYVSNTSNSTTASKPSSYAKPPSKVPVDLPTIALFGMGSKTATYFLRQALDAGYNVRALIIQQSSSSSKKSLETSNEVSYLYDRDPLVHNMALQLRDDFSAQESRAALHWIRADSIFDVHAIRRTLRNAQYVVSMMQDGAPITSYCMHNDQPGTTKSKKVSATIPMDSTSQSLCLDHSKPITSFINLLYPIMHEEMSIKVFLYQANSLAPDLKGKIPMFSKVLKTASTTVRNVLPIGRPHTTTTFTNTNNYADQSAVLQEIARHHRRPNRLSDDESNRKLRQSLCSDFSSKGHQDVNDDEDLENAGPMNQHNLPEPHFSYIITRPTSFLKDGSSGRKVSASKSQPGPFPIAHCDLAEFSLNALVNPKLYNSCPYVVADSF